MLAVTAPAEAQERAPAARQSLVDLSYVLGESHALRRACVTPDDLYWYARMQQLIDVEGPDQGLKRRLVQSFNTGFAAGQAGFPACDAKAQAEAAHAAQRGRNLAAALAEP